MQKSPEPQQAIAARLGVPMRITIPATVAYDLKAFHKGIANLVERLGCRTCFSGADCTFQLERDFVINERLEISAVLRGDPSPTPNLAANHARVTLPSQVSYNIDQVQKVVANIAGRLGCPACCSGFDITFLREREFLINEALDIRAR